MKVKSNENPKTFVQVFKLKGGMFFGEIWLNGVRLEKVGGKTGYMSELNCIDYLNKRVDTLNSKHNSNIPYLHKEAVDENAKPT